MGSLRHLGIIMDGNGRWAERRHRRRFVGHLRGAKVARQIIEDCADRGLEALTLYAFSTENWFRPVEEVSFLMQLLRRHLVRERSKLLKNNIRFRVIGDLSRLPKMVKTEVLETVRFTRECTGMTLTFALSYGSRQEIAQACKNIAELCRDGKIDASQINESLFANHLQTVGTPEPDLIVRTSGEHRLSNFMLWQAAYSEFYVTDKLWPDFTATDLDDALHEFHLRERRFGRIKDGSNKTQNPSFTVV